MTPLRLRVATLLHGRKAAVRAYLTGAKFTDVNPPRRAGHARDFDAAGDRAMATARRRRLATLFKKEPPR